MKYFFDLVKRLLPKRAVSAQSPKQTRNDQSINLNRDSYIKSPSPIEHELLTLFTKNQSLTIFDIGACEGEDSVRYSKIFPNAKIYAFEPIPTNVERIKGLLAHYKVKDGVSVNEVALSDSIGPALLHVSSGSPVTSPDLDTWDYGNKSSSLLGPASVLTHYPWLRFDKQITVITDTVKRFCAQHNIELLHLMHLDVQGAELRVLLGAGDIIKSTILIWLEVERIGLYSDQPLIADIEGFMRDNNFLKIKDTVLEITGDQLYLNQRFSNEVRRLKSYLYEPGGTY